MDNLEHWARANLSPEYQEKFFAEQERIREDCERIEQWHYRPEEAMKLTGEQIEFLKKHDITISTAYIGMVRVYIGNRTIFQTSAMATIAKSLFERDELGSQSLIDYEGLTSQMHEYLNLLMSAPPETQEKLLQNNMPLFGAGELEQIRGMCNV